MLQIDKNYLKEHTKEERQSHIDLSTECIERGGNSTHHKGVLSQYLNTTIPSGRVLLCHACNNRDCSNPTHLYWGSDKENVEDSRNNGTWKSAWDYSVEKYGYDEACKRQSRGDKSKGGRGNKGIPKSEEHRKKISESLKKKRFMPVLLNWYKQRS